MNTIYRIMMVSLMLVYTSSCIKTEVIEEVSVIELTAVMEYDTETRTSLSRQENGVYYPLWSAGDEIAVYRADSKDPDLFTLKSGEGTTVAGFSGSGNNNDHEYLSLYPFNMAGISDDGYIHITIPEKQEYVPDSFAQGSYPMFAVGKDRILKFMNLCSLLKVRLQGKAMVRSVTLRSNDPETYLAGRARVSIGYESEPNLLMDDGGCDSVTLECGGLELSGDTSVDLYIVIPAQTYKGGFTVEIDTYSEKITRQVEGDIVFSRSQVRTLNGIELDSDYDETAVQLAIERDALIDIYKSLDGDNWTNNRNWCSDKPVGDWFGVDTDYNGFVWQIHIDNNNLSGSLPSSISDFKKLEYLTISLKPDAEETEFPIAVTEIESLRGLSLSYNNMIGEIPEEVYEMPNLEYLYLERNNLIGQISENIGKSNLVDINLSVNRLSGEIPESIAASPRLKTIQLNYNNLSGDIPEALLDHPLWEKNWHNIVLQKSGEGGIESGFNRESIRIKLPDFSSQTVDGSYISDEVFKEYKYTVVYSFMNFWSTTEWLTPEVVSIYEAFKDKGLLVYSPCYQGYAEVSAYIDKYDITWPCTVENDPYGNGPFYPYILYYTPCVGVYDSDGIMVYGEYLRDSCEGLSSFINSKFLDELDPSYESSDYSEDGTVVELQKATRGNGINVVLMGDAYSDRMIASGRYRSDMETAYNSLFTEEPYRSYKDMFNVSYVNVVSGPEVYGTGRQTALECKFDGGVVVSGNDSTCFRYAHNVVTEDEMDETLVIVVMNADEYAGTCYMYYPEDLTNDYGSGAAIAYFSKTTFAQTLHHEACGHGFAKLADEYYYEGSTISDQEIAGHIYASEIGWWKNVDFTSDPSKVKWSYFIEDERYAGEGIGVFEGAATYQYGAYKPTEISIMSVNTGGFNAPSREAIYYRIHKLAYGDDWEYDYEKFVEYDAINRAAAAGGPQKRRANYVEKQYEPLHPPVVVGKTWREAGNN